MRQPAAILTDIEGTTTPIAFVRDVLFPYARARLPGFIDAHGREPEVAALLAEAADLAGGLPVQQALLRWMDEDAKVTPLKTLQGLIWDAGYREGALKGRLYPDVPTILRSWHETGIRLFVYSSGSEAAQKMIFGHSDAGDLAGLFSGFFDTRIGPKRHPDTYESIARATGVPTSAYLFLSDSGRELDAASAAGMQTCQLVRPEDGTIEWAGHAQAADFNEVATLWR